MNHLNGKFDFVDFMDQFNSVWFNILSSILVFCGMVNW